MVTSVNIVASENMVASGNIKAGGYNTDRVTVQGLVKSYQNYLVWDKHQSLLMLLLYVIMIYMLISMITFFM